MNGAGTGIDAGQAPQPLPYRLRWRPGSAPIGAHPGLGEGGGGEFRRHVPLLRHPDPRRIDLRVTFRDPLGELHVRQFAQSSAIAVVAIVDLSGSMGFEGRVQRMQAVAELCAVLAVSACRTGDRFGLIGCDAAVRDDLFMPATRRMGLEFEVYDRVVNAGPRGASARGLAAAVDWLPARRSLVFLISDFLMPAAHVDAILDALWRHDVVPVVVRDQGEEDDLPAWGLVELRDLETGRRRLVVMRPSLRAAWREAGKARRAALDRLFERRGRAPFHLVDRLDTDALTQHLIAA
jgi:uncharacterized protein (DUF58 family)